MFDSDNKEIAVAVKIPEVDYDNSTNAEAAKKDLTREMFTMHSFNHHNIVKLIRVSESELWHREVFNLYITSLSLSLSL